MSSRDMVLGSTELGVLISSSLYGVTSLQAYLYMVSPHSQKDPRALRVTALCIWLLETVHIVFLWDFLYYLTVTNFGDISAVLRNHWSLYCSIPTLHIIAASVQGFFAYRILRLSRRWVMPCVSWLGSLLRVIGALAMGIIGYDKSVTVFVTRYRWLVVGTLITAVAVDILNAAALCFLLWRMRAEAGRSRRVIQRLVMWSIETGTLTSFFGVLELVILLTMPANLWWQAIAFFVAKLYSNSFFASLNGRAALRDTVDGTSDISASGIRVSGIRASGIITLEPFSSSRRTPVTVQGQPSTDHHAHEAYVKANTNRQGLGTATSTPLPNIVVERIPSLPRVQIWI